MYTAVPAELQPNGDGLQPFASRSSAWSFAMTGSKRKQEA
jgi:hypothetical protein